jgi:hypothetical protein
VHLKNVRRLAAHSVCKCRDRLVQLCGCAFSFSFQEEYVARFLWGVSAADSASAAFEAEVLGVIYVQGYFQMVFFVAK